MIPIVIMAIEDESDRDYITGLFLKNERSMYAMALKIVKEHHTACDMVSEACLKMIEKIGYLREISVQKQTPYTVSKTGTVSGPVNEALMAALNAKGFIAE